MTNKAHITQAINDFIANLQEFRDTLQSSDGQALMEFFNEARRQRDDWLRERFPK